MLIEDVIHFRAKSQQDSIMLSQYTLCNTFPTQTKEKQVQFKAVSRHLLRRLSDLEFPLPLEDDPNGFGDERRVAGEYIRVYNGSDEILEFHPLHEPTGQQFLADIMPGETVVLMGDDIPIGGFRIASHAPIEEVETNNMTEPVEDEQPTEE